MECFVLCAKMTGTIETINEYEYMNNEIRVELIKINNWIKDLDDKFINNYWKMDDYQRIGGLLENKLIPRIKKILYTYIIICILINIKNIKQSIIVL